MKSRRQAPLTVGELHKRREDRAKVNHETYRQLWGQVQERVRLRAANGFTDLLWQVPPLVLGRPVYKVSHAARYVCDKLRLGGFEVTTSAPSDDVRLIYASWKLPPPPAKTVRGPAPSALRPPEPPPRRAAPVDHAGALERLKARLKLS